MGRFLSRDAVLSEHPYLYCEHEPVNRVDPSGHAFETLWDIGNIAYDIYTRNWGDLLLDVGAALLPGIPAGGSKLVKVIKKFTPDQQALIDLVKEAQRRSRHKPIRRDEAETLVKWAREYGLRGRLDERHERRRVNFPHIHIGPVNHIRIEK